MYDNRFLSRLSVRSTVYLSALVVGVALSGVAMADVATPPPSAPTQPTTTQTTITQAAHRTPVEQALIRRGLDPNNLHGATVSFPNQKPAKQQFGSVQNGVATKSNPVRITDPYGNVARTTVQTQTQLPANSKLNQMFGVYAVGQIAGNVVNSENARQAARDLAQGNYGSAAANAAASFDVFNVGSGVYGLFDEYENAKAAIAQPMHDAAKAKAESAAQAAQAAAQADGSNANFLPDASQFAADAATGKPREYPKLLRWYGYASGAIIVPKDFSSSGGTTTGGYHLKKGSVNVVMGTPDACKSGCNLSWETIQITEKNYAQYKDLIEKAVIAQTPPATELTINDFLLNDAEIQAIIANTLGQILSGQQQNTAILTDLVNMLWAGNQLNASNTQTNVVGTPAQNTFLSEPYTPAGSNQAQQTQHVINKDGSVTTSYIPRSDLKPNSNQAPTLKPKKDNDIDVDIDVGSDDKKEDDVEICNHENKDKVICLNAGSDDYENLDLPSETETLGFNKKDYFARNAACPAAVRINAFGMDMSISYEPWCDIARGIRPIIEFLGVLTAMGIAYGAVREL